MMVGKPFLVPLPWTYRVTTEDSNNDWGPDLWRFLDANLEIEIRAVTLREAADTATLLISEIPAEFWKEEWPMKSLDTSAGRVLIADSIRKQKSNVVTRPDDDWRSDVPIYRKVESESDEEGNV